MFDYRPEYKIFLAANHKPIIRGTDYGIWRRVHLIPYGQQFKDNQKDKHLLRKLRDEFSGILTWLAKGCLTWQKIDGLEPPESVVEATRKYKTEMDALSNFIKECCEEKNGATIPLKTLYSAYKVYCEDNDDYPLGKRNFSASLEERGFKKSVGNHNRTEIWDIELRK